jgi:hypothetical protein
MVFPSCNVLFFDSLSLWERVGVRAYLLTQIEGADKKVGAPHPSPLPEGEGI